MRKVVVSVVGLVVFLLLLVVPPTATKAVDKDTLPSYGQLTAALQRACAQFINNGAIFSPCEMWASLVGLDGAVKAVTKDGRDPWRGSRVIAMQKANTAVLFSKDRGLALSTANLFSPVQPGGSLFGLQFSNPVDAQAAYRGLTQDYGTVKDPAVGRRVGGVNVFGGGLPLYDVNGRLIGGLGVSGDSSCADHNIAWRMRHELGLNHVPAGVNKRNYGGAVPPASGDDNIIYEAGGFSHPKCGFKEETVTDLPSVRSVSSTTAAAKN